MQATKHIKLVNYVKLVVGGTVIVGLETLLDFKKFNDKIADQLHRSFGVVETNVWRGMVDPGAPRRTTTNTTSTTNQAQPGICR